MKKILLSLVCLLAAAAAGAQVDQRLGVRVTWDLNSPVTNIKNDNLNNGSGFAIGAFYDIPFKGSFFFEPGLSFFYNTIGFEGIVHDGSYRNVGFRIPIVGGYRFDFTDDIAMSVFTGPQLNIGLSMKEHFAGDSEQMYGNGWHRLDMQWLFGLRFHYQDNFFAEITGGPGMTNILGGKEYKGVHMRRNIFSVGVGYYF